MLMWRLAISDTTHIIYITDVVRSLVTWGSVVSEMEVGIQTKKVVAEVIVEEQIQRQRESLVFTDSTAAPPSCSSVPVPSPQEVFKY